MGSRDNSNIADGLRPMLSTEAVILLPGSREYDDSTPRWSTWFSPNLDAVVRVATEEDVSQTVKFANARDRPFIAISGTHGTTEALGNVKGGIGILMRGLNNITVADDGQTASIGGGVISGEVWETLWPQGKETVMGCCAVTGFVAPMLGGGHGWNQGRYGLLADNLLSARMVIANGDVVTVSDQSHQDLFWAIRGAGHNFGIVTNFQYKIYDRALERDKWCYEIYMFTLDKLEKLFTRANEMINGAVSNMPVELIHWSYILNVPDIDPNKPVIMFYIIYQAQTIPSEFTKPMHDLGPINVKSGMTEYPGLAKVTNMARDDPVSQPGRSILRAPVGLERYDIEGLRAAVTLLTNAPPALSTHSVLLLEGYSTHQVQKVSEERTAFPDRRNELLISPCVVYAPDASLDAQALSLDKGIRDALVKASGKPLNAYVNYAHGDESLEALYGYEPWRLERLRRLKKEYDPEGRFNFYAPIR